jgi:diguanylate cyclase (GGDEF)-like protein
MHSRENNRDHAEATTPSDTLVIARIVDRRLLRNLLDNSASTLIIGILVAVVVGFAVWRSTGNDAIAYWIGGVIAVSLGRLAMLPSLRRRLEDHDVRTVGRMYAMTAAIAGITWAAIAAFDTPTNPVAIRVFILIVLVGMPVASLSTNAVYRPVFYAFSVPLYLAMLYWSWWLAPELGLEFSLLATAYAALVAIIAARYHESLRRGMLRDVENESLLHEVSKMNDELQRMAFKDSLTGLSNRRSLEKAMKELLERRRDDDILAIMLIDMDNFKWINDNLGHAAGDTALITLSRRIENSSRLREMVAQTQVSAARIGGDEFIVVYRLEHDADISPLATRILEALTQPIRLGSMDYELGVSIGIALAPEHGNDIDTLLRAADVAMYEAKDGGGSRFAVASSATATRAARPVV